MTGLSCLSAPDEGLAFGRKGDFQFNVCPSADDSEQLTLPSTAPIV